MPMLIQHSDITGKDYIFTGVLGICYICNNKCPETAYAHGMCMGIISQTLKKLLNAKDHHLSKSTADRNIKIGESGYL